MRASETYQEWGKNYEKNQNTVTQKRCGYVASNRSRFSKHQMTRVLYSQYISQIEKIQLNQTIICRLRKVK